MKKLILTFAKFVLFAAMLFQQSLFSQERSDYLEIKSLLERKDFITSQRKINSLLPDNPSDPDLLYLQAETWFQKAEFNYKKENYKTANDLYKQALTIWPNHQILNERINSLTKKHLTDNNLKDEIPVKKCEEDNAYDKEIRLLINENFSSIKLLSYNQSSEKSELIFSVKSPGYSTIPLKPSGDERIILLKPSALAVLIFLISAVTLLINPTFRFLWRKANSFSN